MVYRVSVNKSMNNNATFQTKILLQGYLINTKFHFKCKQQKSITIKPTKTNYILYILQYFYNTTEQIK